jgi:Mce-associated membrane protein
VSTVNRWLTALVAVLVLLALLGGALVWRTHGDRADAVVREQRYGDVLAAADAEVTAFVNLRYDQASRSIDAVAAGATGDFRAHYVRSARHVVTVLRRHRSVMTGQVVWSGVVAVAPDRATVIAATTGTVSNTSTHGRESPRHFRLRISLLHQDGRWLASDIQFVGDSR